MAYLSNNKRIAKNSLLLYTRMFFLMLVTLYTSRVLLRTLGIDDYGIYNVVGGVVVVFSFISSSLSSATQRFISFFIGKGNKELLKKTFDMSITIFLIIGIILFIIIELGGVYFLNFKMNIPDDRMEAANWVLQLSTFSFFINVISVPYNSMIIAYEKMDIYAYFSIIEFMLKLLAALLVIKFAYDRLILYSLFLFVTTIIVRFIFQFYCVRHFPESRGFKLCLERGLGKEILSYSGWNMIGSLATISRQQGINILQNLFFGPVINAAHAISLQVSSALIQFTTNVFLATRPSITKLYAQRDFAEMWKLVFYSTKYTLLLFALVMIPLYCELETILKLWLGEVSFVTIQITKLMIASVTVELACSQIFAVFQAANLLKRVQTLSCSIIILTLPISYIALKVTESNPLIPYIVSLIASFLFTLVTLLIARIQLHLRLKEYIIISILRPLCIGLSVFFITKYFCSNIAPSAMRLLYTLSVVIVSSVILFCIIGITKKERIFIFNRLRQRNT